MEGFGGHGYEAFVEGLQCGFSANPNSSKENGGGTGHVNSSRNGFPPHPSQSHAHHHSAKHVGYPSPTVNAFATANLKRDPSPSASVSHSPTASDGSMRSGSVSMDFAMQEGATSSSIGATSSSVDNQVTPARVSRHRRAHSEITFRNMPNVVSVDHHDYEHEYDCDYDDDDNFSFQDNDPHLLEPSTFSDEAYELFSIYFDSDNKLNSCTPTSSSSASKLPTDIPSTPPAQHMRSLSINGMPPPSTDSEVRERRPRHQHSLSMDGSLPIKQEFLCSESLEMKKSMGASKLAELAMVDPKRAKR